MDNLQPVSHLDPNDVPEGFTVADPNAASSAAAGGGAPSSRSGTAGSRAAEREAQQQAVLEQALTPDALARLNRIKLVKADKAQKVSSAIVQTALRGQLPGRISEGKLIEMLERGSAAEAASSAQSKTGGSIRIQRKKYADSDDDDDDNDDDL